MMDLTDLNLFKGELNARLFPKFTGRGPAFRDEHAITALEIQTEVKRLIATKAANQVTVVVILSSQSC
jgi:hypothetical protein